jgi:geranylgeranylglycerol-phosphate geranylgeranyltransferase
MCMLLPTETSHRLMARLTALTQLTRPHNALAAALLMLLGAYLSGNPHFVSALVLRAAAMVWAIVAACTVLNDYLDVPADKLNNPQRPIPSGRISRRGAIALLAALSLVIFALAWTLNPRLGLVALGYFFVGIVYSIYLKGTVMLGNSIVGLLSGGTVIYGALVAESLTPAVMIAAGLVFLFVLLREVLGTIADQQGDASAGVSTVTTRWGQPAALALFQILGVLFAGVSVLPWFIRLAPNRYLIGVLLCSTLPTLVLIWLLRQHPTLARIRLALRVTKFLWFSSLLPLVLLK